ncbi:MULTISPECIES: hypothetical protein [unclassified Dysgonomonas]|uniref:hypothetical protein n=1 Tax=unclassified Dysgonomonas TaxID=2630389 RepID=UPI0025BA7247|nr:MULTISPECIES: hypothetical protein [unclassified Dysgonomonas]HMM04719.1 hypothetical protein [Dysgonomonas sp.]
MSRNILYPYTLEKKGDMIKLEIMPKKTHNPLNILYIAVMIMSSISIIGCTNSLFWMDFFSSKDYFAVICIIIGSLLFLLLAFYLLKWERKGKEIFILHPNRLENIVAIKPFKIEKHIFDFEKLEIGYQSGEDFYSEEEAILLGVELDLNKVTGNYPIQFYMDDGLQIVDSEREIPIEVIRRIKEEYLLNQHEKED